MKLSAAYRIFSGVFASSVISILGVVLFLRFGWIIGHTGMLSVFVMLLIAHAVSFSTGLIMSAISSGGQGERHDGYRKLTRNPGLPSGGATGVFLLLAVLSRSSLFVLGLAEAFVSVTDSSHWLHMGATPEYYRLAGIIFLLVMGFGSFFLQKYILRNYQIIFVIVGALLAYILSMLFIEPTAEIPLTTAQQPSHSHVFIFGILFPAVTGFSLGTAMIQQLRKPERNAAIGIPVAILTVLAIYVVFILALRANATQAQLIADKGLLFHHPAIKYAALAAIFLTVLYSLAASAYEVKTIFLALSRDKHLPAWIEKGRGRMKLPLNALLIIGGIMLAGIAGGNFELLALVVSFLFLSVYSFIGVSYFFESWTSPELLPGFRIPRWLGVASAFACFAIMFKISVLGLVITLAAMTMLYVYLKRRKSALEFGDLRQSIWASLARIVLHQTAKPDKQTPVWRPNIVLFNRSALSGQPIAEIGKAIVGRHGFLTCFELNVDPQSRYMVMRNKKNEFETATSPDSPFAQSYTVKDYFTGISQIIPSYGFANLEPNTVLMGLEGEIADPEVFTELLHTISDHDLSVILLDYDNHAGFGSHKQIDIWWTGNGSNTRLALELTRFIKASEPWKDARLRLLLAGAEVNSGSELFFNAKHILDKHSIDAEIKIIENSGARPLNELIRIESINTDLIFIDLPDRIDTAAAFCTDINNLMQHIGSLVLLKASRHISELNFVIPAKPVSPKNAAEENSEDIGEPVEAEIPANEVLAAALAPLRNAVEQLNTHFRSEVLEKLSAVSLNSYSLLSDLIEKGFESFKVQEAAQNIANEEVDNDVIDTFLDSITTGFDAMCRTFWHEQQEILEKGIQHLVSETRRISALVPAQLVIEADQTLIAPLPNDTPDIRVQKWFKRIAVKHFPGKLGKFKKVRLHEAVETMLPADIFNALKQALEKWNTLSQEQSVNQARIVEAARNSFQMLWYASMGKKTQYPPGVSASEGLKEEIQAQISVLVSAVAQTGERFVRQTTNAINTLSRYTGQFNLRHLAHGYGPGHRASRKLMHLLNRFPKKWHTNQQYYHNRLVLHSYLMSFDNQIRRELQKYHCDLSDHLETGVAASFKRLKNYLEDFRAGFTSQQNIDFKPEKNGAHFDKTFDIERMSDALDKTWQRLKGRLSNKPETIELPAESSLSSLIALRSEKIHTVKIRFQHIADYLLQEELILPILTLLSEFKANQETINSTGRDVSRLLAFSLNEYRSNAGSSTPESGAPATDEIFRLFEEQTQRLDEIINNSARTAEILLLGLNEREEATVAELAFHTFVRKASQWQLHVSKRQSRKHLHNWLATIRTKWYQRFVAMGIFRLRQARSLILERSVAALQTDQEHLVDAIQLINKQLSPDQQVMEKLPVFYKQLFLHRKNFYSEFFIEQPQLLAQAREATSRYKSGNSGAILVQGLNDSGKSFLAQQISEIYGKEYERYIITPLAGGAITESAFKDQLQKATGRSGSVETIMNEGTTHAVFIIENLELWWEKSDVETKSLDTIIALVNKYCHKHLFIITINPFAYKLINKLRRIETIFISIMHTASFGIPELQQAVMTRQKISGYKLYGHRPQKNWSPAEQFRYFSRLFQYSTGNIGTALNGWLVSIGRFGNDSLHITPPPTPDLAPLSRLSDDQVLILFQLLLHRQAGSAKIQRLTLMPTHLAAAEIMLLKRCGMLVESTSEVFEINPCFYIPLMEAFHKRGLI